MFAKRYRVKDGVVPSDVINTTEITVQDQEEVSNISVVFGPCYSIKIIESEVQLPYPLAPYQFVNHSNSSVKKSRRNRYENSLENDLDYLQFMDSLSKSSAQDEDKLADGPEKAEVKIGEKESENDSEGIKLTPLLEFLKDRKAEKILEKKLSRSSKRKNRKGETGVQSQNDTTVSRDKDDKIKVRSKNINPLSSSTIKEKRVVSVKKKSNQTDNLEDQNVSSVESAGKPIEKGETGRFIEIQKKKSNTDPKTCSPSPMIRKSGDGRLITPQSSKSSIENQDIQSGTLESDKQRKLNMKGNPSKNGNPEKNISCEAGSMKSDDYSPKESKLKGQSYNRKDRMKTEKSNRRGDTERKDKKTTKEESKGSNSNSAAKPSSITITIQKKHKPLE